MKRLIILLLANLFCQIMLVAQTPNIDLVKIEGRSTISNSGYPEIGIDIKTSDNNVFVIGSTKGVIDSLNIGSLEIKPDDDTIKTFVYKYDLLGNKIFGFTIRGVLPFNIIPTSDGGCYISIRAEYNTTIDLDPAPNVNSIMSIEVGDRLFAKYNTQGLLVWVFKIKNNNSNSVDRHADIEIDASENLYICGDFIDSIALDPSNPNQFAYSNSPWRHSSFLVKFNTSGQFVWGFQIDNVASYYNNRSFGLDISDKDELFVYGILQGNADIDPDTSLVIMDTLNGRHFVAIYDVNGSLINGFNFGDTTIITTFHYEPLIGTDSASNIYIGCPRLGGDLDPGAGQYYLPQSNSFQDYTIVSFTKTGQLRWANRLNRPQNSTYVSAVFGGVNSFGNVVIANVIKDPAEFDWGVHSALHKPKVNPNGIQLMYFEHTVISEYNNQGYYSGSFDPVDTSNYSFLYHLRGIHVDNDCNIYTTGMALYAPPLIPTDSIFLESALGSHAHAINKVPGQAVVSVKYSDSFHINPIAQNDTSQIKICAGDSLTINMSGFGNINWYDAPVGGNLVFTGIMHSLPPLFADTSFYVEDVRCNVISGRTKVEVKVTPINNTVSVYSDTLTANQNNATYQWIDCTTNLPLPNDTNQFIYGMFGTFAVDITTNGCTRRSPCVNMWPNSVGDYSTSDKIKIYPNPSTDFITMEIMGIRKSVRYQILDPMGKNIFAGYTSLGKTNIDISALAKGVYFLHVDQLGTYKVLKK